MPAAGSVTIQATTMLPATPQRTADSRRVAPTPMIDVVVMCVVDTGTANTVAVVIMTPEATGVRAGADRERRGEDDPQRDVEAVDLPGRVQRQRDDAHGLLSVLHAVTERHG